MWPVSCDQSYIEGSRDGTVVRALASHQCGLGSRRHMWVEFVGSQLCTERFSPRTPLSSKTKILISFVLRTVPTN